MLQKISNLFSQKNAHNKIIHSHKPRILYLVKNYPQLSQTYIKSEINAVLKDFDVKIISTSTPNFPDNEHHPYDHIAETKKIIKAARKFNPCIVHGHYLVNANIIADVANGLQKPFTIRAHSFDAIKPANADSIPAHILKLKDIINSDLCLGILSFPFTRHFLENDAGINAQKIIDCPPVVDFHKFYNQQKNGTEVMNTGASIPKKRMQDFIKLATIVPDRVFNLYAIGHGVDDMIKLNKENGNALNVVKPIPFSQMPSAYKKHGWIVYTACKELKTVGWPMALAEAQASGVVACMANIRQDINDYLGQSGYIYSDIEEMASILSSPPDQSMREMGFDNARRFDINDHKHLLTDLWQPHLL